MSNKLKFWIDNARAISVPQSLLPSILTISLVASEPDFSWWKAIVATFGVVCAHLGMNLADDYFDFRQDTTRIRAQVAAEGTKTHLEKCHYILSGKSTIRDLAWAIVAFLGVAGLAGASIVLFSTPAVRWQIAAVAVGGLLLGISYSGAPLKLGYRGFGEFVIGAMFGPLLMAGMSLATVGHISSEIWIVSVAVGLLVVNIGYVHSVLDVRADTLSCRKSFAVLVKTKPAMLVALALFTSLPFCIVVIGACVGILPWASLATLILLPLGVQLVYSTYCFLYDRPIAVEPRWWLGPMGDWEKYREADMDWFLFRWLVARNLVTFFCLILVVVNVIQVCL